ncbi:hypothetical protein BTJ39_03620 [Izhakiella australiensis]|uniref:Uncharacterized protein n=1 Tax=Izhakiella australiensis TaxID=1926881 RepID=A0A1S8YPK7_9GAMM|nr:hypothetical protein [Izhakiella australiensis]OON41069.1 hypothetical protein BTJ39_03620 [Izhakiella australiensis]
MNKNHTNWDFSDQLAMLNDGGEITIEQESFCTRVVNMAGYFVALTNLNIYPSRLENFLYVWQNMIQDDEHFLLKSNEVIHVVYIDELDLNGLISRIKDIYNFCAAH